MYEHFFYPDLNSLEIEDWSAPTQDDLWKVQRLISTNVQRVVETPLEQRPFKRKYQNTTFYGTLTYRMGRLRLVSDDQEPTRCIDFLGNDPDQRERCVICYVGYPQEGAPDRDYALGIENIRSSLKHFGFNGHFFYYIGGWPGAKRERLRWADAPYSFKPFLFEEARDLGYKQILWLDCTVTPVKSLDPVFEHISKEGIGFHGNNFQLSVLKGQHGFEPILPYKLPAGRKRYLHLISTIVGFDTENKQANALLDRWIINAEMKAPFLQGDQPTLTFMINDLGLYDKKFPASFYVITPCNTLNFEYKQYNSSAVLYHQYDFINPRSRIPDDLFSS